MQCVDKTMPKRKNSEKDDFENLARKLRKIERKLKKARRRERRPSSSSRSSYDDTVRENSNNKGMRHLDAYNLFTILLFVISEMRAVVEGLSLCR